jgi:hypothetical protein
MSLISWYLKDDECIPIVEDCIDIDAYLGNVIDDEAIKAIQSVYKVSDDPKVRNFLLGKKW